MALVSQKSSGRDAAGGNAVDDDMHLPESRALTKHRPSEIERATFSAEPGSCRKLNIAA